MAPHLVRSALVVLLTVFGISAGADNGGAAHAGMLKRVIGEVMLQRGGSLWAAAAGQPVHTGDLVRTGPNGSVAITLTDDTTLSAGPNSALEIAQYQFNATTHEGGMLLSVWRGAVAIVTGLLARQAPEKVNIQTRAIMLGVRGTEFIIDAGESR